MNITGKEIVSASNIKALWDKLFSDTKILEKIRNSLGLGTTLEALPIENGGTGCTSIEDVKKTIFNFPTETELLEYIEQESA